MLLLPPSTLPSIPPSPSPSLFRGEVRRRSPSLEKREGFLVLLLMWVAQNLGREEGRE